MMMATALLTSVVGAAGSAATAIGGAISSGVGAIGSAAGSITGGGISALDAARGGVTALQAYSTFSAGRADANQLEQRALDEKMMASNEFVASRNRQTEIGRQFLDVSGQQKVAFAANGIDLGSGSVQQARRISLEESNRQANDEKNQSATNDRVRLLRARALRKRAKKTRKAGIFGAITKLVGGGIKLAGG